MLAFSRILLFLLFFCGLAHGQAYQNIGGGIGQFDGGIGGSARVAAACGGYQGPGDKAAGAVIGLAIRAWYASTCGQAFANVCVSGVCADMLTSAATGVLVPQTINGTLCPAASTTACVVKKWYDQTKSNACTGSCDMIQDAALPLPVLTTTCPTPIVACIISTNTGTTPIMVTAGNFAPIAPFTIATFVNYSGAADGSIYVGYNNNGTLRHSGTTANEASASCDGVVQIVAGATDASWNSLLVNCSTLNFGIYVQGIAENGAGWTPTSTGSTPYVLYAITSGDSVYEVESGIWSIDVSSDVVALYNNQKAFYGFTAPTQAYFANAIHGGSDANPCTMASPCATITKFNSLVYAAGNTVSFNRGDTFNGCLSITPTNATPTALNPLTITNYGTGALPIINTTCSGGYSAGLTLDTITGVVVNGLNFVQGGNSPATMAGILIINTAGANPSGNYTIENNSFSGGFTSQGGGVSGLTGGHIVIRGFTGGCANISNVSLLNNTMSGTSGVTSLDQNGIMTSDGCSNTLGGNLMNWTAQGNLCSNLGGTNPNTGTNPGNCILLANATVALQQFNLGHDLAWNCTVSPGCGVGFWFDGVDQGTIQFSEAYNIQPGFATTGTDFDGFDQDMATTHSATQYTFSHANYGYGYTGVVETSGSVTTWGPNTVRYAITENDNKRTGDLTAGQIAFFNANSGATPGTLYIYNTTIWNNQTTTPTRTPGYGNQSGWPGGVFANNIIAQTQDSSGDFTPISCGGSGAGNVTTITQVFENNDYNNISSGTQQFYLCGPTSSTITFAVWAAAIAGSESGTIQTAPGFAGAPPDAACTWTPSSIVTWPPSGCAGDVALASGAQNAKSAGNALASASGWPGGVPTKDFYQNTVPGTGSCWNIGAYGVCP
jgi:hypothetical protein